MSLENKKPSFKERLEGKKIVKYVLATMVGVAAVGGGLYVVFDGGEDNDKTDNIDYTKKLNYNNDGRNDEKITSLIGTKVNSSDPYSSIVDPTLANVISGTPQQTKDDSFGGFSKPLYSVDDKYSYKDGFDYEHATDAQLKQKIQEEEGKKIVKIGSVSILNGDGSENTDWRNKNNSNQAILYDKNGKQILGYDSNGNPIVGYDANGKPIIGERLPNGIAGYDKSGNPIPIQNQKNTQLSKTGSSNVNSFPLLYDKNGKQILGYDSNGNPIVGYDANGKPIIGERLPNGIAGYDKNGKPISKLELVKNLSTNANQLKDNIFDKNGKLILGYDKNGNPIVGYDSNGKPILGITEQGIDGYDKNGNKIINATDSLYKKAGITLFDKNGKPILGYDANGNPIIGYDTNGKPILGKVDKGIAGYDANGRSISENVLKTMSLQKQLLNNLNKPLLDKDGNPIVGFDANGNPIIGFDKSGKPILGKVDKGIAGYDVNGNPILKSELQKYLKQNATDNILAKSGKPALFDKSGNLILGYDNNGKPIIGYDANGNPILGKVDKGIAGYDVNGNPIKKDQLSDFYNNDNFNAMDSIAGAGMFNNNSSVPPISGYKPENVNVNITPQTGGINLNNGKQFLNKSSFKESNPWDDALSKSNPDADKAALTVSLQYKDVESKTVSQNNGTSTNVSNVQNMNNSEQNSSNDEQKLNKVNASSTSNSTQSKIALPEAPYNKYTLKKGSFIPMILETGINSDLPGSIIGRVSSNVYDSATGKYLLIPQGSILLGSYSANVTYGQERVMVAWNSLIYPDASEISIGGQPGTDLAGYAGLNDQVNNHYWSLFGNTFLLSVLTAGLEYNQQGSQNSQNNGSSFSSSLSNSSGQMMGQAAAGVMQKSLNIAPTLIIRNAFRGNVLLTQDLALPKPYKIKIYNPTISQYK